MPYVTGFVVTDIAEVHREFDRALRLCDQLNSQPATRGRARATKAQIQLAYLQFNRELDQLAVASATAATRAIRDRLRKTAVRPATGKRPNLSSAIRSRALRVSKFATGVVGVADIEALDRITNPFSPGYGPYWRAQEHGTGTGEVPSQVGRVIRGYFVGKGGGGSPEPPRSQYAGGGGPHPIFVSAGGQRALFGGLGFSGGAGSQGGVGGYGTIGAEIRPRHFIRDGAAVAEREWRSGLHAIEAQTIARLSAVLTPTPRPRDARGRFLRRR